MCISVYHNHFYKCNHVIETPIVRPCERTSCGVFEKRQGRDYFHADRNCGRCRAVADEQRTILAYIRQEREQSEIGQREMQRRERMKHDNAVRERQLQDREQQEALEEAWEGLERELGEPGVPDYEDQVGERKLPEAKRRGLNITYPKVPPLNSAPNTSSTQHPGTGHEGGPVRRTN